MNFTREPIIETVITPKEGYKLIIRSSRGDNQEEYSVNAVEVIAFGKAYFFRSLEKPKAFLLPVTEFEVTETRETRSVLKKPQAEKSIKIGGRKSASKADTHPPEEGEDQRKRKRTRKPRRQEPKKEASETPNEVKEEGDEIKDETSQHVPSPSRGTLLPPPTSLISEQISRYKDYLASEGTIITQEKEGEETPPELVEEETPQEQVEEGTPSLPSDEEQSHLFPTENSEDKIVDLDEVAPKGNDET